jgi:NTP pyrophosphatase (non-canonical NTP hydrolase)
MLTLAEYALRANASNQFLSDPDALDQLGYGFFGEIGGLLSAIKKSRREFGLRERDIVLEEIGDALWYLTAIVGQLELSFEAIGREARADLYQRIKVSNLITVADPLTFFEFDRLLQLLRENLPESKRVLLSTLAGDTGKLVATFPVKEVNNDASKPDVLSKVLANLMMIASSFDLKAADVALANLMKIESRWPPKGTPYIEPFDAGVPTYEQLPSLLTVSYLEREANGKKFVIQQINGINIGDRLTDNSTEADGYRFHDVFHLAYYTHLGWSPVIRSLLRLKRKSDSTKDENEDGARAMIIEEGIATWIFNHASQRDYFADVTRGKLEYGLLKQVREMVKGYEVNTCPLWQWELAIIDGFRMFRELRNSGGGIVRADQSNHSITFEGVPLSASASKLVQHK